MISQLPAQDIFTRISDPTEKNRLLKDLAQSRSEMMAKKPDSATEVFLLIPYDFSNDRLTCRLAGASMALAPKGLLITTMFIGGEKYFFQSDYMVTGDQVTLLTLNPLFHLQRREDYRIRIPSSFRALLEITSINNQMKKISIPILDLSGGGCRIQVDSKLLSLKTQDQLKAHIFLPDRSPIQIVGQVRHVRNDKSGNGPPICGIQFVTMSDITKNRIVAVVMDLYRELFAGRT